ncbi:uncharacterized protein E0L32_009250 [Thyridium curvatum]|uniref:Methyltransferase n=1 Tax=Thyridium curvatum TaxID=1093900 RepID=A0A507AQ27_9PEZI|nr:uncharacterized protein E0L32_009250 [Thyridium curvatum]TPX09507.1 hypothetical protein E0L32_009250 [Thyridium curvatum]
MAEQNRPVGPTTTSPEEPAQGPEAASVISAQSVEVDDVFDDNDSAIGESVASYSSSLAESVQNYPMEHGRRYHAYRSGRYSRPNDEVSSKSYAVLEMDRLLLLHEIMTKITGGLYQAPIEKEKVHNILDIGTGTGIWAITVAEEFENATVIGNDLSANMPNFIPPNVKFEVDDVEEDWLYGFKFDWIFCRYMAASILDWPKLVGNIYGNLRPGGWGEFQDFDLQYYSDDGSLKPDDPLLVWISTLLDAARSLGRDPNPGSKLEGWARDAGFKNIVHKRHKIPIGPWAKDPLLKEVGAWNYMQVNGGLEGLSLRLYTGVLGWTPEQVTALLIDVRKSLRNPHVHAILDFHVVYGQKP